MPWRSDSSRSSESSSQSESSGVRFNCSSCKDTGYRWVGHGQGYQQGTDLQYCTCPRGYTKKMEKVVALEDISEVGFLPKNKVACKICLRVMEIKPDRYFNHILHHHDEFTIDPTDRRGVVTCNLCSGNRPILPPKNVVSMYHNRRKLRVRRR